MMPIERLAQLNTKDNLWVYVLSLLKEKDVYAWEILKLIEQKFGFKPGRITPYRVLYGLEENGFVKSKMKDRRRVYKITNKGEKEFQKALDFYKNLLNNLK